MISYSLRAANVRKLIKNLRFKIESFLPKAPTPLIGSD